MDSNFVRIRYLRYADDFIIGIAGPRDLAVKIHGDVKAFLREELKLNMSESKTQITHFTHKKVFFLGTYIFNPML
jgi:hypothetical protein